MRTTDDQPDRVNWRDVAPRPCPVASALDLFGDRWSMLIIRDVMNGVRRFDDLVARLGISRATLADRLRRLQANGVLVTADYDDARGRVRTEYRLSDGGNEPLRLVNQETGNGVRLELVDKDTGEIVERRTVRHAPGPAFRQVSSEGGT